MEVFLVFYKNKYELSDFSSNELLSERCELGTKIYVS